MKVIEEFFKPVLEKLYSVYPNFIDSETLRKEVMKKETTYDQAKGVCLYLADRGWAVEGLQTPESRRWRITALGIAFWEEELKDSKESDLPPFFTVDTRAKNQKW